MIRHKIKFVSTHNLRETMVIFITKAKVNQIENRAETDWVKELIQEQEA